jgi:hypothetical protein
VSGSLPKAEKLFETFHQFEPVKVGSFNRRFEIPREANYVGEAKQMLYTSDKLNPETGEDEGWISYYHDHDGGVRLYLTGDHEKVGGELRKIPEWIRRTKALVRIGDCDGFEYVNFLGKKVKAKSTGRKPEWYATPTGKALLVVQDKKTVLAIAWGGSLGVQWRGVVG